MPCGAQLAEKVFFRKLSKFIIPNPNPFPSGRGLLSGAAAPATLLGASPQTPFIVCKEVFLQSKPRNALRGA